MKKTLTKTLAIALSVIALCSLSFMAIAVGITDDEAKGIALSDAGYTVADVIHITAGYEIDDGVNKWNVDFIVEADDGRYVDYDYEINAADGVILEREREHENDYRGDGNGIEDFEDKIESFFHRIIAWILSLFS
ncbi:MAG: hypothetical protein IJ491_01980 [Clostridia bacterium]|nr:hypothetical protein [Clostridia bacterium]